MAQDATATAGTAPGTPPIVTPTTGGVFRREGDFWTVTYEGVTLRLRDAKGLQYLAYLLAHPGERVSVLALGGGVVAVEDEPTATERTRVAVTKRIKESIRHIAAHHTVLGYHLTTTIKTGSQCVCLPDPQRPVGWSPRSPSRSWLPKRGRIALVPRRKSGRRPLPGDRMAGTRTSSCPGNRPARVGSNSVTRAPFVNRGRPRSRPVPAAFMICIVDGVCSPLLCNGQGRDCSGAREPTCWGRCYEGEGAPAFWPWVQLIVTPYVTWGRFF